MSPRFKKGVKVVFALDDKLVTGKVVNVWPGDQETESRYTIQYELEVERAESDMEPLR